MLQSSFPIRAYDKGGTLINIPQYSFSDTKCPTLKQEQAASERSERATCSNNFKEVMVFSKAWNCVVASPHFLTFTANVVRQIFPSLSWVLFTISTNFHETSHILIRGGRYCWFLVLSIYPQYYNIEYDILITTEVQWTEVVDVWNSGWKFGQFIVPPEMPVLSTEEVT